MHAEERQNFLSGIYRISACIVPLRFTCIQAANESAQPAVVLPDFFILSEMLRSIAGIKAPTRLCLKKPGLCSLNDFNKPFQR